MALGSLAIETWLIALPVTRKLLPCRDSAQQDWWVSLSHLSAKPGKRLQPSFPKAGRAATRLCAEMAEKDTALYTIPAAASGSKK